jgi:ring-1,2-phenylacetyl-CoA epoxidase subunit PaaC
MTTQHALTEYLLRLGDSDIILAQRLCEWIGKAPVLEEELALGNVALDLFGQARSWLEYAANLQGEGRSADDLVFGRNEREYRNLLITEQANGNYADTLARQYLFDAWHYYLLQALQHSTDEQVAAIAAKGLKEVTYHLRRSSAWIKRLGDGTEESHLKMQQAIDDIWTYSGEMMMTDAIDAPLIAAGIVPDMTAITEQWQAHVSATLAEATLICPAQDSYMQRGGKQGLHGEQLGYLLAEMQYLPRTYPDAVW